MNRLFASSFMNRKNYNKKGFRLSARFRSFWPTFMCVLTQPNVEWIQFLFEKFDFFVFFYASAEFLVHEQPKCVYDYDGYIIWMWNFACMGYVMFPVSSYKDNRYTVMSEKKNMFAFWWTVFYWTSNPFSLGSHV
jgi:hypothetical protein